MTGTHLTGMHPGWGITAVRVAMGLILLVAGYDKWAAGIGATSAAFERWSIPLPGLAGPLVGALELGGGALLIVGLLSRWVGLAIALQFLVAAVWVKFRLMGWDPGRLDVMLLAGGLLVFLDGPGKAALDAGWRARHA
ncbi:MAG: DoxX family protein [Candidatus Rokuibacteriota bacterium]